MLRVHGEDDILLHGAEILALLIGRARTTFSGS